MSLQSKVDAMKRAPSLFARVAKYTAVRAGSLLFAAVVAVYLIIIVANLGGFIDEVVKSGIALSLAGRVQAGWLRELPTEERYRIIEETQAAMEDAAGLNEPFMIRCFRWLGHGLTLDWTEDTRAQILDRLPRTLLLFGPANLVLFFTTVFLAASLARKHGGWLDRLIIGLSPLSSVPAWVFGIVLNLLFLRVLGGLSAGGAFDAWPKEFTWSYVPIVLKHMLMPSLAIFLSGLFQGVYAWRTLFLIYSSEDYVELAEARGLPPRMLDRRYILRPLLPSLVTSFALLFISLWQEVIVLEQFFKVDGIGRLLWSSLGGWYVDTPMIVAIVTIFAYLLAITVFLLDVVYALVDPRVRIEGGRQGARAASTRKQGGRDGRRPDTSWTEVDLGRLVSRGVGKVKQALLSLGNSVKASGRRVLGRLRAAARPSPSQRHGHRRSREGRSLPARSLKERLSGLGSTLCAIARYPSAVIGLVIIVAMIGLSIYAVIALPYGEMIQLWREDEESWRYNPQSAAPAWVNFFRREDLPETIILDSREGTARKSIRVVSDEMTEIAISFPFDYPYGTFPQDITVYVEAQYDRKLPHLSLIWVAPDGREIEVSTESIRSSYTYILSHDERLSRKLGRDPSWAASAELPPEKALFADPAAERPTPLQGSYELRVRTFVFEEDADVEAKFVLSGQVYGLAGTDERRRDLMIPLLWGMPVALSFGLLAAVGTSISTMIIAAVSTWFGGWVDGLLQRVTEVNLILPFLPVSLMVYILYSKSFWMILGVTVLLSIFGNQLKNYRSVFLQVKEESYIEAAQAYGAGPWRIIFHYLIPRIVPVLVPQLVILVPGYVFLEATLAFMGVSDPVLPTWGKLMVVGLSRGIYTGDYHLVLWPLGLLLLVGFAFVLLGLSLERVFQPRLRKR